MQAWTHVCLDTHARTTAIQTYMSITWLTFAINNQVYSADEMLDMLYQYYDNFVIVHTNRKYQAY